MWVVTIKYVLRGRESEAVWEYDEAAGTLRARGRLATQLGFREPTRRAPRASTSADATKPATRAKKAAKVKAPTTARRSPSRQTSKRVAAARRAAAARMVSEADKATRRNAALARKAAKRPVVLPPRTPVAPLPPLEPLLSDEPLDEPHGWGDELELSWDDADEFDDEVEVEQEVEDELEDELEVEDELEDEVEDELEDEVEVEDEPVTPRPSRRSEPLRARPPVPASSAEQARRRVRIRPPEDDNRTTPEGNGPVFRTDLAQRVSPTPAPPLSMGLQPIEPPRRRRRLRPLRGR
jgi:hypothetical protein